VSTDDIAGRIGLAGFGGWLILVVIGQTLAPFATVIQELTSLPDYRELMQLPNGPVVVYGEVALAVALLAVQIMAVAAMYRRSRNYPQIYLCQWIATILAVIGDIVLVSEVLHIPASRIMEGMNIGRTVGHILYSGLWVIYMFSSVRVRNTFTR